MIRVLPLAFLVAGCSGYANEPRPVGRHLETLEVASVAREYRLTIPKAAEQGKPLPVVVALHGWSGSAELFEIYTGWAELAEKEGFILVAGNGLGRPQGWNVGWIDLSGRGQDEAAYISAVLDDVAKKAKIDPDRVYACGHSNGGFLTWLLATKMPDRFAAVGVVAGAKGTLNREGVRRTVPEPAKRLPSALIIHGDADPVVAYQNGGKATLNALVSQPEAAKWYATRAGLEGEPKETKSEDGKTVTQEWSRDGRIVRFVTVVGGNHDWFGGLTRGGRDTTSGYDCTKELWAFFKEQVRKVVANPVQIQQVTLP